MEGEGRGRGEGDGGIEIDGMHINTWQRNTVISWCHVTS